MCVSTTCADLCSYHQSFWQKTSCCINSHILWGLGSVKIPKQITLPSISKKDPYNWTKHTNLAFQTCLLHRPRCLSRKLLNANHLSSWLGPKPEVRSAQTDLEIVQIFYVAPRNNISFVQLYKPISICMHAWVVLGSHVINFWGKQWGLLKWWPALWSPSESRYCASCISLFLLLGNKSLSVGPLLQPFPLVGRFLSHNSPGSPNHFFVLFIDKTVRKARPNLFLSSPGTSLSIPKQWHLCRAPNQWTLSSGDFNHINTTAEENLSDSPLLKWQTQQFSVLPIAATTIRKAYFYVWTKINLPQVLPSSLPSWSLNKCSLILQICLPYY